MYAGPPTLAPFGGLGLDVNRVLRLQDSKNAIAVGWGVNSHDNHGVAASNALSVNVRVIVRHEESS